MKTAVVALMLAGSGTALLGETIPESLGRRFEYDRRQPLDVQEAVIRDEGGVSLRDVSYSSPAGGRVTAYLAAPSGGGPFPAILFGHWGYGTRTEFLAEALAYARAGVVSLLVDYPWVRPQPHRRALKELVDGEHDRGVYAQAVVDLMRGVDYLETLPMVDPSRLAYVGHSYGAQWGAVLSGIERRIRCFVLVGGVPSAASIWMESQQPEIVEVRNAVPQETMSRYLEAVGALDPIRYVPYAAPAPLLFQFARFERYFDEPAMKRYFEAASQPKQVLWYDTGHELADPKAFADRAAWLSRQLGFQPVP